MADPSIRVYRVMKQIVPLLEVMEQYESSPRSPAIGCKRRGTSSVRTDRSTATIPHAGRKRCPVEWATPIIAWQPGAAQLFSWLQLGPGARKYARGRCSRIESRKTGRADVDERHLFVWMDPSNSSAEAAVSLRRPFGAPVALPIAIDVVWLATAGVPNSGAVAFAGIGVMALWRVRLGAIKWESLPLRVLSRASVAEP